MIRDASTTPAQPVGEVRLDVWLDVACLFRTRSEAKKACGAGRVQVNGQPAKPHRSVRTGDEITIARPLGGQQIVVVRGVADRSLARAEARKLYDDRTPLPTDEEREMRSMDRLFRSLTQTKRSQDKRERRALRNLRGRS
jgi:ribosome-associated heat shock protein Hsp15